MLVKRAAFGGGPVTNIVYRGLGAVVVLAPLALGANRPWSWSLMSLAVGFLLVTWAFAAYRDGGMVRVPARRIWPVGLVFGLLVLWFLFQMSAFAPSSWQHPVWAETAAVLAPWTDAPVRGRITLDRAESMTTLMRLLAYGGVFWLALQAGRSRRRAKLTLWVLAAAASVYGLYGVIVQLGGGNTILWYDKWVYQDFATGPFVNRNSFATYTGMGLVLVLALMWTEIKEMLRFGLSSRGGVLDFFEQAGPRFYALVGAFSVLLVALLLSGSRAGLLSTLVGLSVLSVMVLVASRRRLGGALVAVGLAAAAFYGVANLGGGTMAARFAELPKEQAGRSDLFAMAIEATSDRLWTGHGLGNFGAVYYVYRDPSLPVWMPHVDKAHNTYLELAVEGGLPGLFGMVVVFLLMGGLCLSGIIRRRSNRIYPAIGLAVTALVATHALVDFSLQIPAIVATYMTIMGIACAQSWPSRKSVPTPSVEKAQPAGRPSR